MSKYYLCIKYTFLIKYFRIPSLLKMEFNTLDIKHFITTTEDKMINLKTMMQLLGLGKTNKCEATKKLVKLCTLAEEVVNCFEQLTEMKNDLNVLNGDLEIRSELCNQYIDDLSTYLENNVQVESSNNSSYSAVQTSNEIEHQGLTKDATKLSYHPPLYRPKLLVFDLEEITQNEFMSVPRYLIGSLTLRQANTFIQYFNKIVTNKYTVREKSVGYIEPELKKVTFLTESDLYREKQNCLSKIDEKILNVLCQLKKLSLRRIKTFGKFQRAYVILK